MNPAPEPPDGLGARGTAFWRSVTAKYNLTVGELQILVEACAEADVCERLRAELATRASVAAGYQGQDVADPVLMELRHHGAALRQHVTALRLPIDPADGRQGEATKPARFDEATLRSELARRAANARWHPGSS